jgi:hypothetical protein
MGPAGRQCFRQVFWVHPEALPQAQPNRELGQALTPVRRKWQELLKEAAPTLSRAVLIFNPENTPFWPFFLRTDAGTVARIPVRDRHVSAIVILHLRISGLRQIRSFLP